MCDYQPIKCKYCDGWPMRADLEVLGVGEHPDAALQQVPLVSPGVGSLELSLIIRKRL